MARAAVLEPKLYPVPALRRPWFKNKIICEEGWSVAFSGSSSRVDRYDYYEKGKHLILGGEGAGFLTANWARAARRDRSPESPPVLLTALASGRVDRQWRLPRAPDRAQKYPLVVHSAAELASGL